MLKLKSSFLEFHCLYKNPMTFFYIEIFLQLEMRVTSLTDTFDWSLNE